MIGPKTILTVQRLVETADILGAAGTETWSDFTTISGVLTSPKYGRGGTERFSIRKDTTYSTHVFYCDVPTDVILTEKDRLTYSDRIFNIMLIENPGNMDHHLEITLNEVL